MKPLEEIREGVDKFRYEYYNPSHNADCVIADLLVEVIARLDLLLERIPPEPEVTIDLTALPVPIGYQTVADCKQCGGVIQAFSNSNLYEFFKLKTKCAYCGASFPENLRRIKGEDQDGH